MEKNKPIIGITPYRHSDTGERYMPEGYLKGIESMDCEPLVLDYMNYDPLDLPRVAERLDGMLFSGGVDVDPAHYGQQDWPEAGTHCPERDALELELFNLIYPTDMPILGICRGMQLINVALGGTLIQDIPRVFGTVHQQNSGEPPFWHQVCISAGSKVSSIFGAEEILTDSYHHQSVEKLGRGLVVTARARDGVVEAVEIPGERFFVCLQWHPEKTLGMDEYSIKPFNAFNAAVRATVNRRRNRP